MGERAHRHLLLVLGAAAAQRGLVGAVGGQRPRELALQRVRLGRRRSLARSECLSRRLALRFYLAQRCASLVAASYHQWG